MTWILLTRVTYFSWECYYLRWRLYCLHMNVTILRLAISLMRLLRKEFSLWKNIILIKLPLLLPTSLIMTMLKEWAPKKLLFLSIESWTEMLCWTVKLVKNCQIKSPNKIFIVKPLWQIKSLNVLIPWLMIINKVSLNLVSKLSLFRCVRVALKIMKFLNPEFQNHLRWGLFVKKEKIKPTKFTWMEVSNNNNKNQFLSIKNKETRFTWDKAWKNNNPKG